MQDFFCFLCFVFSYSVVFIVFTCSHRLLLCISVFGASAKHSTSLFAVLSGLGACFVIVPIFSVFLYVRCVCLCFLSARARDTCTPEKVNQKLFRFELEIVRFLPSVCFCFCAVSSFCVVCFGILRFVVPICFLSIAVSDFPHDLQQFFVCLSVLCRFLPRFGKDLAIFLLFKFSFFSVSTGSLLGPKIVEIFAKYRRGLQSTTPQSQT